MKVYMAYIIKTDNSTYGYKRPIYKGKNIELYMLGFTKDKDLFDWFIFIHKYDNLETKLVEMDKKQYKKLEDDYKENKIMLYDMQIGLRIVKDNKNGDCEKITTKIPCTEYEKLGEDVDMIYATEVGYLACLTPTIFKRPIYNLLDGTGYTEDYFTMCATEDDSDDWGYNASYYRPACAQFICEHELRYNEVYLFYLNNIQYIDFERLYMYLEVIR